MNSSHHPLIRYRPEVDGLRAVAVVPVLLFHAGFQPFSGGFVGVDVFFVISGYLISQILMGDLAENRFSLARFYQRRARRILPALFAMTIVCIPLAWIWMLPGELRRFGQSLVSVGTFSSNLYFWLRTDYFAPNAAEQPLLHVWSLAVEEQYYLLFPVLLFFGWKLHGKWLRRLIWLVALASLTLSEWAWRHDAAANFYLLPSRAWELLAGVLIALWRTNATGPETSLGRGGWAAATAPWIGISLIAVAVLTFGPHTPTPSLLALAPVLGAALVIAFATPEAGVGRLLSLAPVVGLGMISYSAYLWHQPLLAFARLIGADDGSIARRLLFVLAVLPIAYLSYRIVEQPFRKDTRFIGSPMRVLSASAAGLAMFCLIGAVFHYEEGFAARQIFVVNPKVQEYLSVKSQIRGWMSWCDEHRINSPLDLPVCLVGDRTAEPNTILWGDSFAAALLPGLDYEMRRVGRSSLVFVRLGCPPLPGLTIPGTAGCTVDVHTQFIESLPRLPKIKHVIWFGHLQGAMVGDEMRLHGAHTSVSGATQIVKETIAKLHHYGMRAIFVEQGPYMPLDVPDFYIRSELRQDKADLALTRAEYRTFIAPVLGMRPLLEVSDDFVDTEDVFCVVGRCPGRRDEYGLIFSDRSHVSLVVAKVLARSILQHLPS